MPVGLQPGYRTHALNAGNKETGKGGGVLTVGEFSLLLPAPESFRRHGFDLRLGIAQEARMPVLSIAGEKASTQTLNAQMKLVATEVAVVSLKHPGHGVLEERPKETTDALLNFL